MATTAKPVRTTGQRLLTWTALILSPIILAGIFLSVVGYLTFRAAKANEVTIDANGKLVGSFRHYRGGITYRAGWPFIVQTGVLSHGTGGACLVAGVTDPATGQLAKCHPGADGGAEACRPKLAGAMTHWLPYCAPEGTCWARPGTPKEKALFNPTGPGTPFMSCNKSSDALDPSWNLPPDPNAPSDASQGPSFLLSTDYPSNAPMDQTVSKKWRVVACINRIHPTDFDWDLAGCSGGPIYGKVLTLP